MHAHFDLDFETSVWTGDAVEAPPPPGHAWWGPEGLLTRLEAALGLSGRPASQRERIDALATRLRRPHASAAFWHRSAAVDATATARVMLDLLDRLSMAGWSACERLYQPRLDALAEICGGLPDGPAQRLLDVATALAERSRGARPAAGIESLTLMRDEAEFPVRWRNLLTQLRVGGTRVSRFAVHANAQPHDLAHCHELGFDPVGDGSLRCVNGGGPLSTADEAARWIASLPWPHGVVVIGADGLLNRALRRHGLPPVRLPRAPSSCSEAVRILMLGLRAALDPADPDDLHALLTLPRSPVPCSLAGALVDALHEWPAAGSPAWERALRTCGDGLDGPGVDLLTPTVPRNRLFPVVEARRRVESIHQWMLSENDLHGALVAQNLLRHLEARTEARLPWDEVARLVVGADPRGPQEKAGPWLHGVDRPGALAAPARHVVWWNFTQEQAGPVARAPLSKDERRALGEAGVDLVDPRREAARRADRWRQALRCAQETLVAFCPARSETGEEQFVHPLWDELTAHLDAARRDRLERRTLASPARPTSHAMKSPASWQAPAWPRRHTESPSSLGALVECPLRYTLRYGAHLQAGRGAPLDPGAVSLGRLAHEIFATVFERGVPPPQEAARQARRHFDAIGRTRVAALFLPGQESVRARVAYDVAEAARDLACLLADAQVEAVESELSARDGEQTLAGRPDLIAIRNGGPTVVDLKWGGGRHHAERLARGASYQLATYAWLRGGANVAYYILQDRRWLEASANDARATWDAFQAAIRRRRDEMAAGHVEAAAFAHDGRDSAIEDGRLVLTPPCQFCDFGRICGQSFGVAVHA